MDRCGGRWGGVRIETKKTEGLELGAVDKLLVGIFVGCDGREGKLVSTLSPDHPIYFIIVNL
jgi:hypothetical protein